MYTRSHVSRKSRKQETQQAQQASTASTTRTASRASKQASARASERERERASKKASTASKHGEQASKKATGEQARKPYAYIHIHRYTRIYIYIYKYLRVYVIYMRLLVNRELHVLWSSPQEHQLSSTTEPSESSARPSGANIHTYEYIRTCSYIWMNIYKYRERDWYCYASKLPRHYAAGVPLIYM